MHACMHECAGDSPSGMIIRLMARRGGIAIPQTL
jgi:hypothetical protein